MPLRAYLADKAEHTHENSYFQEFYKELKTYYQDRDEDAVLIGNPIIQGCRPDAIFIKNEAVCVIDFKDYSGEFHFEENGLWTLKGTQIPIKGGSKKNPYLQIHGFRKVLETKFEKEIFPKRTGESKILVSGMVVFHAGRIKVTNQLSNNAKRWFYIVDKFDVLNKLIALAQPNLYLSENDVNHILSKLNIRETELFKLPSEIVEEKKKEKERLAAEEARKQQELLARQEEEKKQQELIARQEEERKQQELIAQQQEQERKQQELIARQEKEEKTVAVSEEELKAVRTTLRACIDETNRYTFWNDASAKLVERTKTPIFYPKDVEIPSEKYGYGPYTPDSRPELVLFYYAVRSVLPENVCVEVVSQQYMEKYRLTDSNLQESVSVSFYYNGKFEFTWDKVHYPPDSRLAKELLSELARLHPSGINRFDGFVVGKWLETLQTGLKFYDVALVEAKTHDYLVKLTLARRYESLTADVYYNRYGRITKISPKEYNSAELLHHFKHLLA